jgi:hypothetical protein
MPRNKQYFDGPALLSALSRMPVDSLVKVVSSGKLPARVSPAHAAQFVRQGFFRGQGTHRRIHSIREVDPRLHLRPAPSLWDGRAVLRFWPDQRGTDAANAGAATAAVAPAANCQPQPLSLAAAAAGANSPWSTPPPSSYGPDDVLADSHGLDEDDDQDEA